MQIVLRPKYEKIKNELVKYHAPYLPQQKIEKQIVESLATMIAEGLQLAEDSNKGEL